MTDSRKLTSLRTEKSSMADMNEKLLLLLAEREGFDTLELSKELNIDHQKVVGAVKSIQSLGDVSSTCSSQLSHNFLYNFPSRVDDEIHVHDCVCK